jgi:2-oxoisovalerate dehydrogenase E2 component (dihydrolipoyl transacylase)
MKIELPQVGESVTEAIVGRWLKQVGDRVEKYDPLVEVVTDKVNMEFPSPESGVLSSILVEEGQTVPMGAVIAEMDVDGESAREDEDDAVETETVDRTGTLLKDVAPVGPTGSGGPMTVAPTPQTAKRYSPAVVRLAAEHDLDLSRVTGTGIGGRITRKDVQGYLDARRAAPKTAQSADEERVPLTPVRRMIAANMVKSVTEIPEAWTVVEADVSGLVELREGAKAGFQRREGVNLTYLPFVVKAVAEALKESPIVNSTWGGDAIILKRRVNVGVAIAAPDGLVVPVVQDSDSLSVAELAKAIDELATRAREGKLNVTDVQSGTFTINNTGALGSVTGKAIINHPQAAILNTEAIVKRPVVVGDDIVIRSIMNLCLTFDHRIMDGAEAGAFVSDVKRRLEAIDPSGPGI